MEAVPGVASSSRSFWELGAAEVLPLTAECLRAGMGWQANGVITASPGRRMTRFPDLRAIAGNRAALKPGFPEPLSGMTLSDSPEHHFPGRKLPAQRIEAIPKPE